MHSERLERARNWNGYRVGQLTYQELHPRHVVMASFVNLLSYLVNDALAVLQFSGRGSIYVRGGEWGSNTQAPPIVSSTDI